MNAVQLELGERLRDEGIARAAGNNADWLTAARNYLLRQYVAGQRVFTSDDVQVWAERTGNHPRSSNVYGSIFKGRMWRLTGRTKSRIASNHAREIKVWEYVE